MTRIKGWSRPITDCLLNKESGIKSNANSENKRGYQDRRSIIHYKTVHFSGGNSFIKVGMDVWARKKQEISKILD